MGFVFEEGKGAAALKAAGAKAVELSVGVELIEFPAAETLKIPIAAKKLLADQSCEAVVALAHASEESHDALALLHNKLIDVELSERKFVFLEVIFDDEWKTDEELEALCQEKIVNALRKAIRAPQTAQTVPSVSAPPDWMPGIPAQETSEREAMDFMGESGEKLF